MKKELVVDLAERIPQAMVSRVWGWVARRRRPRLGVSALKRVFVRATGIDMNEAADSIGAYDTLQDLFVRRLRPGTRRIVSDPRVVISPVDGQVGACGTVQSGTLMQIKGRRYSLERLLGDSDAAARFEGGAYVTIYLSPKDYHRIHAPVSGQVAEAALIPGRLFPVFPEALERIDELFARNERLITYVDGVDAGRVAVVKVGATLVGRITAAYDPTLATNQKGQERRTLRYDPPRLLQKGSELGAFELGSTVVLVAEPDRLTFEHVVPGAQVRMGQRLGTVAGRVAQRSRTGGKSSSSGKRLAGASSSSARRPSVSSKTDGTRKGEPKRSKRRPSKDR